MTSEPESEELQQGTAGSPPSRSRVRLLGDQVRQIVLAWVAELGTQRLLALTLVLVLIASPWPLLTIAALLAYALVAVKTPEVTTALIPLAFPFAYRPKDFSFPFLPYRPEFPVVELLLFFALATSGLQLLLAYRRAASAGTGSAAILDFWDETKRAVGGSFGLQAATLGLIALFSLLTVADPAHLRESIRELRTVVIGPLLYYFLARHWLRERDLRHLALGTFIGGATLVGLLALGQVATGRGIVVAEGVRRALGTYDHPNALALYLERALAFTAALIVLTWAPRRTLPQLIALPIIGLALVFTFSRGAFIGVGVALAILGAYAVVQRGQAVTARGKAQSGGAQAISILGAVAAAVAILLIVAAGIVVIRSGSDSLALRQLIWRATLAMIRDHLAFGVGLDQFYYQYAPRYIQPAAWGERYTSHPHNLFLDFWVRLGIMGLAWVCWTLWSVASYLARAWRPVAAPPAPKSGRKSVVATSVIPAIDDDRRVLIAAGVACVAAVTHGLLDNFYFLIDLAFVWWFLLALVQIGAERQASDHGDAPSGK